MAIEQIKTYNYKELLTLSTVRFDQACVFNKPEQVQGYSIYWIKEGKGVYNIDFKSYSFDGNILFFLSPGQVFSIESESIKEAYKLTFVKDFYCIQTHDKEIACNGVLFNNIYETPFVKLFDTDIKRLDFILENLIIEFESPEVAQYDMLQSFLKQFIIHAVRIKKDYHFQKQNFESELFKNFSLLVEQNFKTLHSVTDYANRLGLSPKSLTKHFNNVGVDTPSDFIKDRIILEAKRMLLYTDSSVKHIAYDLGFNDSAYFTRFFKKALLESPLQFKKSFKAQ